MKALVAGATGYLGHFVVRELARRGVEVRALARNPDKLEKVQPFISEVFQAEATDDSTLEGLCDGCELAFSSLGIRAITGRVTYEDVDYQANLNVLNRAREAGVRRFSFISVLDGEKHRAVPQVDARERVVAAMRESGLEWTVVRPTGFFNDMAEFFGMAKKGSVWIVGEGSHKLNPVGGQDLAAFCADRMLDPKATGHEYGMGGPDILTMREIAELALEVAGHPDGSVHSVPGWVLGALGAASAPFSRNFSSTMKMFGLLAEVDAVGEKTGALTLRAFFQHLAGGGAPDDLDIPTS